MLESNLKIIDIDVQTLVKDAHLLFQEAAALTGTKAEEVRNRAMHLLERATLKTRGMQAATIVAGKEMAASADGYVKENPWRTMAAAAGAGVLLGVLLGRR
jgi:ElaB/YqjD/DUF883 family membrane-anchored ribosome-binding protein